MKTSENGVEMVKGFEADKGFSPTPYKDLCGFNTIGYGHKIRIGEICDSITEEEALQLLEEDLGYAEGIINHHVTVPLNQNQFDALVSFVYNLGPGRGSVKDGFVFLKSGRQSTMLQKLNAEDYDGCAGQFLLWDHADGVEVEGLKIRRQKEMDLFMTPVEEEAVI